MAQQVVLLTVRIKQDAVYEYSSYVCKTWSSAENKIKVLAKQHNDLSQVISPGHCQCVKKDINFYTELAEIYE